MQQNTALRAQPIGEIQHREPEPTEQVPPLNGAFPQVPDGCRYSPTCLDCPLPQCRHDYQGSHPPSTQSVERARIAKEGNMDVDDVAAAWRTSKRNAYRILDLARDLFPTPPPPHAS